MPWNDLFVSHVLLDFVHLFTFYFSLEVETKLINADLINLGHVKNISSLSLAGIVTSILF